MSPEALLLAAAHGAAEALPVSSSGHLAAAEALLGVREREDPVGLHAGALAGLAQAAALWPGVSRNGAALAAARLRGFAPGEANSLAREVGVPVTAGAIALRRAPVGITTAASFVGVFAALPLARRVDRGGPLWPWAAERALVALALLRQSRR